MTAVDTKTMLGMREHLPKFEAFFLSRFFRRVALFDTKTVEFDKVRKGVKMAAFVSPIVAGRPNTQAGVTTVSFTPAYVKPTDIVDPGQMVVRMAGETTEQPLSPSERRDLTIMNLLADHEDAITAREEWMAVQAVMTGTVTVSGEDYPTMLVDYGRTAANNVDVAGGSEWDAVNIATYDPSADIEDWAGRSRVVCDTIIFAPDVWPYFASFASVKSKLDITRSSKSELELGPQLAKVVQFKGYFGEYACYVYKGKYENSSGTEVNFMPAGTILMCPGFNDDVMCYGAIQDAKALSEGISAARRYAKNWISEDPALDKVQTQSAPIPCTLQPDDYVAVTVL